MSPRRIAAAIALAAGAMLGVAAPVSAAPTAPAAVADVDDFEFRSMSVEYELGRDADGRSTLRTVEHLVATFPEFDQNRGIRRAIPRVYDGHTTELTIVAVTDETGTPRSYVTATDGDFLVLTIAVPPGQFVHGDQHYVIEYTQHDVTRFFEDTNDDEFYWDINGTGWAQPFGDVSATLTLDRELASLVTEAACYRGYEGSTETCPVEAAGETISVAEAGLGSYQNVTLVVAFPAGTFTPAPFNPFSIVPWQGVIGVALSLLAGVIAVVSRLFFMRDAPGRGLVIAQYEPPRGISIPLAADLLRRTNRSFAATVVKLAVHGHLLIVERSAMWWRKEFGVKRASSDAPLLGGESRLLEVLFMGSSTLSASLMQMFGLVQSDPAHEGVRWFTKGDTFLGKHVQAMAKEARAEALQRGLTRKPPRWPLLVVVGLNVLALVLLIVLVVTDESEWAVIVAVLGINLIPWVAIGSAALLAARRPLTRSGAEVKEHLEGLKLFISWAEQDRLQMLQSPSGAERSPLEGASDPSVRILEIYENLLPYAILFGQEKQWAAELSKYYATQDPRWYSGTTPGFQAAAFASGLSSFAAMSTSAYSGSSGSSTSGGSGGGGSSGGGGGGGGGGGV